MEQQPAMEQDAQHNVEVCEKCGGANLQRESTHAAFWHDDRLVVIEDIPALVCSKCREQFYDDTTVVLIDLLSGQDFPAEKARSELRVPVFSIRDMIPPADPNDEA